MMENKENEHGNPNETIGRCWLVKQKASCSLKGEAVDVREVELSMSIQTPLKAMTSFYL